MNELTLSGKCVNEIEVIENEDGQKQAEIVLAIPRDYKNEVGKYDVDFIGYNAVLENYSDHYLASLICRWDLFYKDILQRYLKGELVLIRNHWIGVQQGAIILSNFSNSVSQSMQDTINDVSNELADNKNFIFNDDIYDNEGVLRCKKNQVVGDYELLRNIHWLVRGVEVVQ